MGTERPLILDMADHRQLLGVLWRQREAAAT